MTPTGNMAGVTAYLRTRGEGMGDIEECIDIRSDNNMSDARLKVEIVPVLEDHDKPVKLGLIKHPSGMLEFMYTGIGVEDGEPVGDVSHFPAENAAARRLEEQAGIVIDREQGLLFYFMSHTYPDRSIGLSFYAVIEKTDIPFKEDGNGIIWLTRSEIIERMDIVPGVKDILFKLIDGQGLG